MKIIIVGNGKVGYAIARQLAVEGHDITMVDSSPVALARADSTLDIMCVEGNGASISVLEEADGYHEPDGEEKNFQLIQQDVLGLALTEGLAQRVQQAAGGPHGEPDGKHQTEPHELAAGVAGNVFPTMGRAYRISPASLVAIGRERNFILRYYIGHFLIKRIFTVDA